MPTPPQLAASPMPPPRYPGARWVASPNHGEGRQGQFVKAVCLHITAGAIGQEYENAVTWFHNPASEVSAQLVIGPAGQVTQCVEFGDTAWANGISWIATAQIFYRAFPKGLWQGVGWYSPRAQRVQPTWQLIQQSINPNLQTISIEIAGQSHMPHPEAQIAAVVAALRWLGAHYAQLLPYVPGRTLIGHFMIDPLGRPDCPGQYVDLQAIAAQANGSQFTPGIYRFAPLAIFERPDLTGKIAAYLPSDSQADIEIDATTGPGYAPTAGHVRRVEINGVERLGPGFVDLRRLTKV